MKENERIQDLLRDIISPIIQDCISTALKSSQQNVSPKDKNDLIGLNEAAILLNIAKSTLYAMTSQHKIPYYKQGKKLYFKRSELLQWVENGKKPVVE